MRFRRIRSLCVLLSLTRHLPGLTEYLHLQNISKLQCVEDFLEGMLGKLKFE
jgi:hypothetical protein